MPKKFDQDAKDRVVRLVEDRILAEGISMQEACKIVARNWVPRGTLPGSGLRRPVVKAGQLILYLKISLQRWPSCVARIRSFATLTSC